MLRPLPPRVKQGIGLWASPSRPPLPSGRPRFPHRPGLGGLTNLAPGAETTEKMQNKIVVRYRDRRLLKGSTTDFVPTKEVFHLSSADGTAAEPVEVRLSELKAVFFVKDLNGNRAYQERKHFDPAHRTVGRKIGVVFKDGELLVGTTEDYEPGCAAFFVTPADPGSNNERCLVVSNAVENVSLI